MTGIVNITAEDYEAMPPKFDGEWLRSNFPGVAQSMERFINKIKQETQGEIIGEIEIVRIPLESVPGSQRDQPASGVRRDPATTRLPAHRCSWRATRPSARRIFSRSRLGFECAMFLAGLLGAARPAARGHVDRYELYMYKQWLRVYMRSKMIKHNKDLFETLDDTFALLEKLHIY